MNKIKRLPDSVEYQLGIYVGEYIVSNYLPTISTDMMHTNKVIKVSEEDTKEFDIIHNAWAEKILGANWSSDKKFPKEWNAYLTFRKKLQKKYMPETLKAYVPKIKINKEKIEDLKHGIAVSLWDCDCCSYHIEHDKILIEDSGRHTTITLQLDNSFKLEKE